MQLRKRQIFHASSWNKVRAPAGAVRCELRDAGMQWPEWDTFDAGETLVDCRVIAPSDLETFLVKKAELVRWKQKQIDEMENGVSFELMRTLLTRKCDQEWAQEKKNRAKYWVINGAVAQDVMCKYGWVKDNGCSLCGAAGTEKHR